MESPSAPPHRWCIPWQRLLLTGEGRTTWERVGGGSWGLLGRTGL
uniref:Carcinoembryonic antigen n=1 Tax=Homo sapiens TaxID=9606 RepID=Q14081_HUMAN|nr:carcinoembryonic antigen [Homo sapiens]